MKSTFFSITFASLAVISSLSFMTSCKKDSEPKEGTADITLTFGGQQIKIVGPCGWAVAGGVNYIGANDANNSLRVFETSFNITSLPTSTTTYTLVADQFDENPNHVWANITEIQNSTFIEWSSSDLSGNFTLVVDGDKFTVNLAGITLDAGDSNVSPYNADGTLTGTLEFYRE